MTEFRHDAMARIAEACADDAEVLSLSIIRMIAAGYSTGDVACWDMAYAGAERSLDAEAAAELVGSLTTLVRALRSERLAEWYFMPATCCRVTRDEAGIVHLIGTARRSGPVAVTQAAAAVTGAQTSPRTVAAAGMAGRSLDKIATEWLLAPARPSCGASRFH